jgi:hypothetical protein
MIVGSDFESAVEKVKDAIGSVLGGSSENLPRADEDPDIEYPEPLDQQYIDDGKLILPRRDNQTEQDDLPADEPNAGTEDTTKGVRHVSR